MNKEGSYSYTNVSNSREAFDVAEKSISKVSGSAIEKFKLKFNFDSEAQKIEAKGKGIELALVFNENSVDLLMKLSFLVKPFKEKISSAIMKELEKNL